MPEFITYDLITGKILDKYYSADPSVVTGLPNCIQIPRDLFNSLTKYHIVDAGQVRLMTQTEKDTLDAEEAQAIIDAENARITGLDDKITDDLSSILLTKADNAIDNIGNLNDAKIFLKKLCRYIIKFIARQ